MKTLFTFLFFILFVKVSFAQDSTLIKGAISQLNLDQSKVDTDLIVSKVQPNNPKETILVIPVITEKDEDYFKFDGYILIVNNETGKIINHYIEREGWVSDAIILSTITIDSTSYIISESIQAFGIRVHYYGTSQPNPYANSTISLFIKSKNTLEKILKSYDVINYSAEWDTFCAGESVGHEKRLTITTKKTNGFFDILVKDKITYTESYKDKNGECNVFEKIEEEEKLLKFNGKEYTEDDVFFPLEVFIDDSDYNPTNIRQTPNGEKILSLNQQNDLYILTITESNNGWFKVTAIKGIEEYNIAIPNGEGWIHHSVIGISTRKNIKVLDTPEEGNIVGTIEQEIGVRIKDKYLNWVKIEYKGILGWIESKWLCGNPVTTCP